MKELNDIKESKIINLLIPEAINQNNLLRKEIRQRIRLNKIFNEFENKASNEFSNFINKSNQRYNSLKNGHNLKNILINSKQNNINDAHKILEDPFYNEFNLQKEKEKMKLVRTKDLNKNMSPLLLKMKQPETINLKSVQIQNFEQKDMYDYEYDINNKKHNNYKEYINNIIQNKKSSNNYWSKKPTSITRKKNLIKFKKDIFSLERDKNYVQRWFKREENLINKSFNNYKHIFETENNNNSKISLSRKEMSNHKIYLPRLKLLNYKSQNDLNKNNLHKDTSKNVINYNYLLSFSDKSIYKFSTPKKEKENDEIGNNSSMPLITDINNISYKIKNYGNTLDIVVNSAKKELDKEKVISYKRRKLEKIFGGENAPNLKFYDEILKRKSAVIKNRRKKKNQKIIESQKYLGGNKKDTLNLKIDNNIQLLDHVYEIIDKYNESKNNN